MANYGIKVSEPGFDVKTAADKNLSMKPDLAMLKVFSSGSTNLSGTATISHALGYIPQFLVFVYDGTDVFMATGNISYGVAYSNTANLYISDIAGSGGATSAKYYIFYEQA